MDELLKTYQASVRRLAEAKAHYVETEARYREALTFYNEQLLVADDASAKIEASAKITTAFPKEYTL